MIRNVPEFVAGFYDANIDPSLWPATLANLAAAFNARAAMNIRHDFSAGTGTIVHAFGIAEPQRTSYRTYFGGRNPWFERDDPFRGAVVVVSDIDLMPTAAFRHSEFFRDWLKPQDLYHHLLIVLDRWHGFANVLVVSRALAAGPFKHSDVSGMKRLLPMMHRGVRAGRAFSQAQHHRQALLDVLDGMPIGILLLNANGGIIGANRRANEIIEGEPRVAGDVLVHGTNGRGAVLREAVSRILPRNGSAAAQADTVAFSLPRGQDLRAITVLVTALRHVPEDADPDGPHAVALISHPDRAPETSEERLRHLYGLSYAEARLTSLLATGHRLDEAAEILGVAYETVRKHLKQVFQKTGVDRQAELVRLVVTGPATAFA